MVIVWMIQPDVAREMFGDSALMESGMVPRFLMFDPKAQPHRQEAGMQPIPQAIKSEWAQLVRSLANTYRQNSGISFKVIASEAAKEIFRAYENENIDLRRNAGELRDLAPFVARWSENAAGIARASTPCRFSLSRMWSMARCGRQLGKVGTQNAGGRRCVRL